MSGRTSQADEMYTMETRPRFTLYSFSLVLKALFRSEKRSIFMSVLVKIRSSECLVAVLMDQIVHHFFVVKKFYFCMKHMLA